MSETISETPKARTVARGPAPNADVPDFNTVGWPAMSKYPFVNPSYYEEFDPKIRPKFTAGAAVSAQMTAEELDRAGAYWTTPFKLVTAFYFGVGEHTLSIPGPRPGQIVQVQLPPFAIVRAPVENLGLGSGMHGSEFATMYAVPPKGDCGNSHRIVDKDNPRQEFVTCKFSMCPQPGHSGGWAHSIHNAYQCARSLGAALPMSDDPNDAAVYIPKFEDAQKMLRKLNDVDGRQLVVMWIAQRLMWLQERETKLERLAADGKSVRGR